MTDHGTLFKSPMIRAMLREQNPKTQTRRLFTMGTCYVDGQALTSRSKKWGEPAKDWWVGLDFSTAFVDPGPSPAGNAGPYLKVRHSEHESVHRIYPRWQVGNVLWVREAWQDAHPIQVAEGRYSQPGRAGIPGPPPVGYLTIYRADGEVPPVYCLGGAPWPYRSLEPFVRDDTTYAFKEEFSWCSSIHMPRWACRIERTLTDVRIERLLDISAADAIAEGLSQISKDGGRTWKWGIPDRDGLPGNDDDGWHWKEWDVDPVKAYLHLWDKIHGADAHKQNPWVIVGDWGKTNG